MQRRWEIRIRLVRPARDRFTRSWLRCTRLPAIHNMYVLHYSIRRIWIFVRDKSKSPRPSRPPVPHNHLQARPEREDDNQIVGTLHGVAAANVDRLLTTSTSSPYVSKCSLSFSVNEKRKGCQLMRGNTTESKLRTSKAHLLRCPRTARLRIASIHPPCTSMIQF